MGFVKEKTSGSTKYSNEAFAIAVISILFAACNNSAKKFRRLLRILLLQSKPPEVVSDKPGKCPECGMTLMKKENDKKNSSGKKM